MDAQYIIFLIGMVASILLGLIACIYNRLNKNIDTIWENIDDLRAKYYNIELNTEKRFVNKDDCKDRHSS